MSERPEGRIDALCDYLGIARMAGTDVPNILADQLRGAIRDSGYSINSLADVMGIPQPVLSRFVNGHRSISMGNAEKIAAAFGMRLTKPKGFVPLD